MVGSGGPGEHVTHYVIQRGGLFMLVKKIKPFKFIDRHGELPPFLTLIGPFYVHHVTVADLFFL